MRKLFTLAATLLAAPVFMTVAAYDDGPPPGRTGGFGEPTCAVCHFDNDLNDPSGSLKLDGVPLSYSPSRTYVITITLARADLSKAGFEIATRFAEGDDQGTEAGTWRPLEDHTKVIESRDGTLHYAEQTLAGARVDPPGTARWNLNWTAPPATTAPIIFHVAANASNDDSSPLSDFIYLTDATTQPGDP